MTMKLIVKTTRRLFKRDTYYYVLVGANGEPMMHSEQIENFSDALESVKSIKRNAHTAAIVIDKD